jgi:sulfate permease, SulP family
MIETTCAARFGMVVRARSGHPHLPEEVAMKTTTGQQSTAPDPPIGAGIRPVVRSQIPIDVVAGLTLAALAIPEALGYARIAGMPVVTGLYTLLIPMALFAVFGSSRHLVVGADSATAAIMAGGLTGLAGAASPDYVALAAALALITGLFLLAARLLRLGFLADFLSRTVLIGFLTGVGVQVAIGQLPGMLGLRGVGIDPLRTLLFVGRQIDRTHLPTLAVTIAVLLTVVGARRINRKLPGALIAVVGGIVASRALDLPSHGIAAIGTVPGGLPTFGLPAAVVSPDLVTRLLPIAFTMFIVVLAQSGATSRAYATRFGERFSLDTDLTALGLANIGAGLSGAFVVNGSPTKTRIVDLAGGRSQIATLATSAIALLALLFLAAPLSYMPEAVLATVVFVIGIELIDLQGMRAVLTERPVEFWVALIAALVVVSIGVGPGVVVAIALSLLSHTRHGYKPRNSVLEERAGRLNAVPVGSAGEALPGLVLYRFNHSMYYANASRLSAEVLHLATLGPPAVHWLCCDLVAVDDVDFSAAATLRELHQTLDGRGTRLVFASASDHVRRQLDASGITVLVGQDAIFPELYAVLHAYRSAWAPGHAE